MSDRIATVVGPDVNLMAVQPPPGKEIAPSAPGAVQPVVAVASIIGFQGHTFVFQENSNTPGRTLEQSFVVTRPDPNSGFFVLLQGISAAFTTPDFQFLGERPLGQCLVTLGLRGTDNLVCDLRLTDSNSDDPISCFVNAAVVFFT